MSERLIDKIKRLYCDTSDIDAALLMEIYAPEIVFVDPIHTVHGRDALLNYFKSMYQNVTSCRFEFIDEVITDEKMAIKWDMTLCHKKLNKGLPIVVRGISYIHINSGQIVFHEDVYDLGALIYEYIPVLKHPVRWVKVQAIGLIVISGDIN